MAHYISSKFASFETTHALIDRDTGKMIGEPAPLTKALRTYLFYNTTPGRILMQLPPTWWLLSLEHKRMAAHANSPDSKEEISTFVKTYHIKPEDSEKPVEEYKTLQEFFARRLRPGMRRVAEPDNPGLAVHPADSRVVVFSSVDQAHRLWIKGRHFTVGRLLGPGYDPAAWQGAAVAVSRLSPCDCHRLTCLLVQGLGTSSDAEAREYFKDMRILRYGCNTKQASDALDLAFNKKRADDRKAWIMESDPEAVLDYGAASSADTAPLVDAADFVHKELIHFSIANLERSIPSGIDGLKVSQRKILWGAFRRRMTSKTEVKVAQFGCYVAEHSAYHHGETSLQDAVIGMAQDFVGANNVALLRGAGQFGTRLQGGKDAASSRYVFVSLDDVATAAFPPADAPILRYQTDDGQVVEPVNYLPVSPWALVNGAAGIGTGFSTTVPSYHPLQLIEAVRAKLDDPVNAKPPVLKPWVAGFTGDIVPLRGGRGYLSKGRWKKLPASKSSQVSVEITELPVGTWTADYKTSLDELVQQQPPTTPLRDFESHYTDRSVRFVLHLAAGEPTEALWTADPRQANLLEPGETPITRFESVFHLTNARTMSTSNMHLYDATRRIRRYEDAHQILDEHFAARMVGYTKRRDHCIRQLEREVALLRARVRFIGEVGSGSLKVHGVTRVALAAELKKREYTDDNDPKSADGPAENAENADGNAESDNNDGYGFLLRMNIGTLTAERAAQLAAKAKAAEEELDALLAKTSSDLWREDLDVLEKAWRGYEARREERANEAAGPTSAAKQGGGSGGRKAAGGSSGARKSAAGASSSSRRV